ncbi:MAG TPA: exo-alpha-sialidase [Candidatus Hydrogenedentes bacterium]|nr:exo-alpha-sialidase [Candidatus Hydrogenedentota bacterium]
MMVSALLLTTAILATPLFEGELIFPPEPWHNHGSSIVETPGGDLLAVWFHGSGERTADDVKLLGARRKPGKEWSAPFEMADTPDLPDCNPVLFVDPRGTLWLFWITVQDNEWGGSLLKYRVSEDYEGEGAPTWKWQDVVHARPRDLEAKFRAVIEKGLEVLDPLLEIEPELKGEIEEAGRRAGIKLHQRLGWMTRIHPIMAGERRILLGLYSDVFNCSLAAWTEDWGKTWQFSYPILDPDPLKIANIQPSFARRRDGTIVAFMRDNGFPHFVRVSESGDDGLTWGPVEALDIRNPGSSVEALVSRSGRWLLVCNDTFQGRHRLAVYLSEDEGRTWPVRRVVEETEENKGSFSYPSIIQAKDDTFHLTFSWRVEGTEGSSIKHVRFNEEWITSGTMEPEK